jgi:lysophospholipase L1-like esterase
MPLEANAMGQVSSRNRRTVILVLLAGLVVALLMLLPLAAGREATFDGRLHYIALGDSIPSGNAFPTDKTRPCQRSEDSYPWMVSRQLSVAFEPQEYKFSHIACSGARVAVGEAHVIDRCLDSLDSDASDEQVDACDLKWLPNQVDWALDAIDGRPTLVTITIGANDTGWTEPLNLISLLLSPDDEFRETIDEVAEQVEDALADEVSRLLEERSVTIILTDIYNPFNPDSVIFDLARAAQGPAWGIGNLGDEPCTGTDRDGVIHELSCAERAEYGLQALSAAIQRVAELDPKRVAFAGLIEPFRGHEAPEGVCGDAEPASGESWIRETVGGGLVPLPDCFHPNTAGAEAIAELILDARLSLTTR